MLASKVVENASGMAMGEQEATAVSAARAETRVNCMVMLIVGCVCDVEL